jgi:tRNA (cytidine32/uridine32-2'-O)-methyltransferase
MLISKSQTQLLDRIKIVLVNTSHPGNIGATARAMTNMGLSKLALVQPMEYPSMQATARAAGADDVLDTAELFPTLAEAVANCGYVYGTTARLRSITWPEYSPQELAEQIMDSQGEQDIALVFGREASGLTNEELDLCQALVHIPVDERHTSLNLASAVMVVAFSIRSALVSEPRVSKVGKKHASPVATSEQIQFYFYSLNNLLNKISFYKGNATRVMRKLRRLYYRAEPSKEDVQILLGTLAAINAELEKKKEQD